MRFFAKITGVLAGGDYDVVRCDVHVIDGFPVFVDGDGDAEQATEINGSIVPIGTIVQVDEGDMKFAYGRIILDQYQCE